MAGRKRYLSLENLSAYLSVLSLLLKTKHQTSNMASNAFMQFFSRQAPTRSESSWRREEILKVCQDLKWVRDRNQT